MQLQISFFSENIRYRSLHPAVSSRTYPIWCSLKLIFKCYLLIVFWAPCKLFSSSFFFFCLPAPFPHYCAAIAHDTLAGKLTASYLENLNGLIDWNWIGWLARYKSLVWRITELKSQQMQWCTWSVFRILWLESLTGLEF